MAVQNSLRDSKLKAAEEIDCLYSLFTQNGTHEWKIARSYAAQALLGSAKKGYNNIVRKLVELGIDPAARHGAMKQTALHQYALIGDCDMIEFLLNAGVDVNVKDGNGQTPLHWTALAGQAKAAKALLARAADPNARDHKQRTPLFDAASKGALGVVNALLSSGADKTIRGGNNKLTPFERAERSNHGTIAALLSP